MKKNTTILFLLLLVSSVGCKKLVQIPPPKGTITTTQVFADSADAAAALNGIYTSMAHAGGSYFGGFANSLMTALPGESADELLPYALGNDDAEMSTNTVVASNANTQLFWYQGYPYIYQANACIEGLQASAGVSQTVKNKFIAEAMWFRAFVNFYLVNLYGNIPLVTTINYQLNSSASNTPSAQVYQSIVSDLQFAQNTLPADFSEGGGERIRVNKWAATALLARVYLYQNNYQQAINQSTSVIGNSSLFSLVPNLDNVFLANSTEAILQWQNNSNTNKNTYNATAEAFRFVPYDSTSPPTEYYLAGPLLNAFENGDMRKSAWIDSSSYSGTTYYYPYKYKVGPAQAQQGAPVTEYYTILRLAEQYLIRAEANANLGNLAPAITDLNVVRNRSGLPNLAATLNKTQVLAAVAQERRIELFAEWGHRWFDLKRTGQVGVVFSGIPYKSAYKPYQQLYPIPPNELQADPNLKQNPGY